MSSKF